MTPERLYYSTKTLHGPPGNTDALVDVHNNWDPLAEVAIASYPESSTQLDHLAILLQSHGVIVHRVSPPRSQPQYFVHATRSPFVTESYATSVRKNGAANGAPVEITGVSARPLSLFPQNAALVYGARVIEAPPLAPPEDTEQSDGGHTNPTETGTVEHPNALFSLLENAGVEVIRWPAGSPSSGHFRAPEGKLVDIEETTDGTDTEEGPRFSPSDIVVLSPTLLITRLSSCTNNKGLEYLWSVLARPTKPKEVSQQSNYEGRPPAPGQAPAVNIPKPPRATTTLLVRITEPEATTANSPSIPPAVTYSPRTTSFPAAQLTPKPGPASYTPLCRALVPIDGRVMLYDPALVAEGEARRLKSVLDRVQEGSRGAGNSVGEMSEIFAARSSKRDSGMSYGTFGSVGQSDEEGWQFISVDGLHSTSILLVSPTLALISLAPSASTSNQDTLLKVSQVLDSLGIRTVPLPFSELNEKGGGVRDAVMVLRRESELAISDDEHEGEQQNAWDQPPAGGEEPTEGCFEALTTSIATFLCGWFTSITSSDDVSE